MVLSICIYIVVLLKGNAHVTYSVNPYSRIILYSEQVEPVSGLTFDEILITSQKKKKSPKQ